MEIFMERTLSILKPDAVARNVTGKINSRFEENGLRIIAQKRIQLSQSEAEGFYAEHKERPFFGDLCRFMTSGPVVVQVLEGKDAISKNRTLMGATNPAEAEEGTIRRDFAESIDANAVHGSDSSESARREISYFFSEIEIIS
jgi:nucleoside-diphosphate kinase